MYTFIDNPAEHCAQLSFMLHMRVDIVEINSASVHYFNVNVMS